MGRLNAAKAQTTERSLALYLYIEHRPTQTKPEQQRTTPSNYWDEWRAREGIVMRHLTPAQYGEELSPEN